jgi:hypothetical protein
MFGRDRASTAPRVVAFDARGGVSPGAILTGVVVAFGATFVFSAIVGGVLVALGISNTPSAVVTAGVGAGIALIVAQLLAYLWGGYAAGRMARGAGLANGLLVPIAAILVAVAVGAIVTALGATANLNLPSITHFNPRLPISSNQLNNRVLNTSLWIALGSLVAMFIGGAIGGLLGARWHTKLERHALAERTAETSTGAGGTTTLDSNRTTTPDGSSTTGDPVEDRPLADTEAGDNVSTSGTPTSTTGGAVAGSEHAGSGYPASDGATDGTTAGPATSSTTTGESRV